MSLREAVASAAAAYPAPAPGKVRFLGKDRAYWRLLIRGALLLICTLGIYRFWLMTDIRRFLWGNSEIAGDHLEYTGTALELLVGFLIAIAILLPINALFFLAALDLGLIGQLSGVMAFALLAFLSQFAIYRARRYRLTRTVYRGVRFYQTGSAWAYAFYALMWWTLIALTLGLAYPWAQTKPRALQDAPHLLRRSSRLFRRLGTVAFPARLSALAAGYRSGGGRARRCHSHDRLDRA